MARCRGEWSCGQAGGGLIRADFFQDAAVAIDFAAQIHDRPTLILAHTTKGKGVSFMENQSYWHGNAPNTEQAAQALSELGEVTHG